MDWLLGGVGHLMPHIFSTEWIDQHTTLLLAHAAVIQIISSVLQTVSGLATLIVMGAIMWMQVRAQRAQVSLSEKTHSVTEQTYLVAQIQKDIAHSQYETGMTQIRWRVWRNYDDQVSLALNQIRALLQGQSQDRDAALGIYSQLHAAGYQLVWTFGAKAVGNEVSGIDHSLGLLVRAICAKGVPENGDLSTNIFLSEGSPETKITQDQIALWEENAPRITVFLDKIVQKIGPFMQIKDPFLTPVGKAVEREENLVKSSSFAEKLSKKEEV
ncbi:hypothetical protein FAI41_04285 [Acetobacteraceae bacterium]|nr:hypothetical protein FAI41_04285 [Acetobacteraceae bacterium]